MALSVSAVAWGLMWALSAAAWAHWVGLGGSSGGLGGRPSQRSRGPEADVAMAREAAVVLQRIVLWPEPEACWDP